ncbi:MAG: hypothetical protein ACXV98_17100 [Ilumatobacteraceae bacterium]
MVRRVLLSILAAVGVGCGSSQAALNTELTTTTAVATIHEDGPLRKIDTGDSQMDAALRGHLAIVGGCVVQQVESGQATIVLWPLEVHWDDTAQQVVFPDDRRLSLGTDVVLGGGEVPVADIETYWPDGRAAAEELAMCQPDVTSVWVAGQEFDLFEAFDLYTHCGIYGTMINGVWWRATTPLGDGHGGPPAGWTDPSQPGTMTFYGDDLAVFTTDDGLLARFTPTMFAEPQVTCASSTTSEPTSPSTAPPTSIAPTAHSANLVLRSDAPTLGARLVDGGAFDGASAAVTSNGLIVMSKMVGTGIELYSFTEGQPPVDTGVGLTADTSLIFGPGGDLFTVEHGTPSSDAVVSQFGRTDGGRLVLRTSASGPITDNACEHEWFPGPSGSAIYVPYLDTPAGGNHLAVFVVDDRAIANGALLGPADYVAGVVGTDLIAVQHSDGGQRLVAIDLTTLLS